MKFYQMLAENYDEIFPFSAETYRLITSTTPAGGRILDIGSATGKYVSRLSADGYEAFGLEYCPELIKHPENTVIGDMTYLPFQPIFDTVVCTGNTLAHASDIDHVKSILKQMHTVLKDGGKALIQILNYDRILKHKPANLPTIETTACKFVRSYGYEDSKIRFTGRLSANNEISESSVMLFPLVSNALKNIGEEVGFKNVKFFGSFAMDEFQPETSFPLITSMSK